MPNFNKPVPILTGYDAPLQFYDIWSAKFPLPSPHSCFKIYICFIDFVELDSLTKTKNSLKAVKGQLKEEVEEKKTLTKTIQDLQSINTEVSILRPEDCLLHG